MHQCRVYYTLGMDVCVCAFVTMVFFECVWRSARIDWMPVTGYISTGSMYAVYIVRAFKSHLGVFTYTRSRCILEKHAILIAASIFWISSFLYLVFLVALLSDPSVCTVFFLFSYEIEFMSDKTAMLLNVFKSTMAIIKIHLQIQNALLQG